MVPATKVRIGFLVFLALTCWACEEPGVGDPCRPESVPSTGFVSSEVYLETSSVQCRSRVCMVYKLQGDTNRIDCAESGCVSSQDLEERVYCSCRCSGPPEATADFCECPDGYSCDEVLQSDRGGPGVRGGYCVKSSTL
jgi:hypothetical protein